MTTEEMWQILSEPGRDALLATVRPDGSPHLVPVWYTVDGQSLVFSTWLDTVKARNMQQNPRVAVTVSQPADPIFFVLLEGAAQFLPDLPAAEKHRLLGQIYARYGESYANDADFSQTVLVRVQPARMRGENYG
jgi:PPOX class probable F420-dependent enzyme